MDSQTTQQTPFTVTDEEWSQLSTRAAVEALITQRLADHHRAICEYSLLEERTGMACTYTGLRYPAMESSLATHR